MSREKLFPSLKSFKTYVVTINRVRILRQTNTALEVSKYGVFYGPYFPLFGLNTEIQSQYRKIRTRRKLDNFHEVQDDFWALIMENVMLPVKGEFGNELRLNFARSEITSRFWYQKLFKKPFM